MKHLILFFYIVLCVTAGVQASDSEEDSIKIGIADWPPYVDETHIALGLVPEIVQLSFLEVGLEVEFVFFRNWAECLNALLEGEIDASAPYTRTGKRKEKLGFSEVSIIELTTTVFYLRGNSNKIPNFNLFENQKAFSGFSIGALSGYFYEDLLEGVNLVYSSKSYINFQKLYLEKIDLVIENELIGWHIISQLFPYTMARFGEINRTSVSHSSHLVVSKKNEEGEELLEVFNQGLGVLKQSGIYDRIIKKYKEKFKEIL
ncbi:MAG: transporter substrate-binding domain-containing protein [Bacteroidetes bacterium]|nr:transporter substrate-binding domain-containing protein [Bacteroidota bacterium]